MEGGSPTVGPDHTSDAEPTTPNTARNVTSWGLDVLDSPLIHDYVYQPPCGLTGSGVDVYILDSGVSYANPEFEGRVQYPGCDIIDETSGEQRRGDDCNGHGTGVAGVIGGARYGVAPGSTLFSIRTLNCNNSGSVLFVTAGLECMLEHHSQRGRPAVVNLSLFGRKSKLIKRAIDRVIDSSISVVTLGGNYNEHSPFSSWKGRDSCKVSPSSIHGVITVSGSTMRNKAYEYTKMGKCVDLLAPGESVVTTSTIAGICNGYCARTISGGSIAAPHVTGAIALLLEKCPNLPPWRVRHLLISKMTIANILDMTTIRRKYRGTTPNLLLHLGPAMCDIEC